MVMVLLGTLLEILCPDFIKHKSFGRLMACFSMITNLRKLFHIDRQKMDQNLGFVHGIRVLTMIWIIAIHTFTVGTLFVPMLVCKSWKYNLTPGTASYMCIGLKMAMIKHTLAIPEIFNTNQFLRFSIDYKNFYFWFKTL